MIFFTSLNSGFTQFSSIPLLRHISGEVEFQKGREFSKEGDLNLAFACFLEAAEKGHTEARFYLGSCFQRGAGIPKDGQRAGEWYRKAADQGHVVARGLCYVEGYGVAQDIKEAFNCFRIGAENGHPRAQFNLGLCYEEGLGVVKNEEEAGQRAHHPRRCSHRGGDQSGPGGTGPRAPLPRRPVLSSERLPGDAAAAARARLRYPGAGPPLHA